MACLSHRSKVYRAFFIHFSHGKRFYNCDVVRGDMGIIWPLRGAFVAGVGIFTTY